MHTAYAQDPSTVLQNTREGPNPPQVVPLMTGERMCPMSDEGAWPRLPVPDLAALRAQVLPLMRSARSRIARSVINSGAQIDRSSAAPSAGTAR
jgi:hypothetical protein